VTDVDCSKPFEAAGRRLTDLADWQPLTDHNELKGHFKRDLLSRRILTGEQVDRRAFRELECNWATLSRQEPRATPLGADDRRSDATQKLPPIVVRETRFVRCRFRAVHFFDVVFDRVSFRDCTFENCDFRACFFYKCDLRFSKFEQTTFQDATIYLCDLFRAWFAGAVVFTGEDTNLKLVSLDRTDLGGADIPWKSIVGRRPKEAVDELEKRLMLSEEGGKTRWLIDECAWKEKVRPQLESGCGVLQEDKERFQKFLEDHFEQWKCQDPDFHFESPCEHWAMAERDHLRSAAGIFRSLAAMYDARGRYHEGKNAYLKAKWLESKDMGPWKKALSFLASWTCSYGESALRVLGCIAALIVLYGVPLFALATGAITPRPLLARLLAALTLSLSNLIGNLPVPLVGAGWEALAAIQTALGIALVGLLGFVLGNVLRRR
jgi:uncharacterized protein YjbI with pentapeptide repeats